MNSIKISVIALAILTSLSSMMFIESMDIGYTKLLEYAPKWKKMEEVILYNMQLAPTVWNKQSIQDTEGNILSFNYETVTIDFKDKKEIDTVNIAHKTFKDILAEATSNSETKD